MRNTLEDLNNHLFRQLEKLSDIDLKGEELNEELKRTQAIEKVAKNIINTGSLALSAMKFIDDRMDADATLPPMLEGRSDG